MIPNTMPAFDFGLGETADMLRDTARGYAQDSIAPLADKIDREDWFPRHLWPEMGALGLHGITVDRPEDRLVAPRQRERQPRGPETVALGLGHLAQNAGQIRGLDRVPPAPLLHAAAHFGVEPSQALMIGDSVSDVKAARAAGFSIVCVSYGYNHGQDIRTAEPDAVIDSMAELEGLIAPA